MKNIPKKLQYQLKYAVRIYHQRSPEYKAFISKYEERREDKDTGRLAKHYNCQNCKSWVRIKEVNLEHMVPLEKQKYVTIEDYYNNMVDFGNIELWCQLCSKAKTKSERGST